MRKDWSFYLLLTFFFFRKSWSFFFFRKSLQASRALAILLFFKKIYSCLFISNCTRKIMSLPILIIYMKNLLVLIYSKLHTKSCDYLYEYFVELIWLARVFVDLSLLKWEELRIDNFFSFGISVPWSVLKQGRKVLSIFKTYLRISLIRQQYKIGFRDELKNPNVIENWNIPFRNNPCSDVTMISIVPV